MKENRDALFVINQDQILDDLVSICKKEQINTPVFLTTHYPFPHEREVLQKISRDVRILTFADILTEEDMCKCDNFATDTLQKKSEGKIDFGSQFFYLSLKEKNRLVCNKICLLYQFSKIYYLPGLGVDGNYWNGLGIPLVKKPDDSKSFTAKGMKFLTNTVSRINKIFQKHDFSLIQSNGKNFFFISSMRRLRVVLGTRIQQKKKSQLFINKNQHEQKANTFFCTTIHEYHNARSLLSGELLVFQDGFIPSNYPRSYIDMFIDASFVVRTMFDDAWFNKYGKKTQKPPEFIEKEFFLPISCTQKKNVLVALNHAGDWTALINRSDTDILIAAIRDIAEKFPEFHFRLRVHPSMIHPAHEGINSINRISHFIKIAKLDNLSLSGFSLEEDLEWADICMSEYSQVLLDSYRLGKIGISINLTMRRSFMQDFINLGFFQAQCTDDIVHFLKRINNNPGEIVSQQNEAIIRYNQQLSAWFDG